VNVARRSFSFLLAFLLSFWALAGHAAKIKDADCLACHANPMSYSVGKVETTLPAIDENKIKQSIHGQLFKCVDCHTDVKSLAHDAPPKKVECAQCHADEQQAYAGSLHAKTSTTSGAPFATCGDCHGDVHEVLAADNAKSPENHVNIPVTCGRCHGQKFLMESNGESAQPFYSYQESVHGRAVANGSQKAAVCTDCHGSHGILQASDSHSPIAKANVPATCGKCHVNVANAFNASIHGQAIARGNELAPVCTDCHGIHTIKAPTNPNSPVAEQNLSRDTCAHCHEGVRLSQEFGVPGNRVSSYFDSYHGLAAEGGSVVAANCSSCHGVHDILPSSDPRSSVNSAHLEATCGKCHKGVSARFIQTRVHLEDGIVRTNDIGSVAVRWVRWIYIPLILIVIGAMFLHNAVIWRSKAVARRRTQNPFLTRMTLNQRWQHLVLLLSFIVLVITGFALRFPETWFAHTLGMGENLRGILHRIAGVALMGAGIYHLFYVAFAREGKKLIRDLMPGPKDVRDVWTAMLYYLGLSREKPKFGRFSYSEKAEYWALVWGTALMAVTGIMLWAKVWVGNLLARWWVDVATAIHFYEAILATLAIIVWHFYQVFLDPDIYPMNWAWWDGKMPEQLYRHEHELDTEAVEYKEPGTGI
jgi:cytochrome b subunit of formate dehydrogenase